MSFFVGQKVVCVDASITLAGHKLDNLQEGAVYTVRWVGEFLHPLKANAVCIRLEEIVHRDCVRYGIKDMPYEARRFRPLTSRESSISFTTGAPLDSERWDNRKQKVRV